MRSSVSYMLSEGGREPAMSHPDYEQKSHDHGALLILTRGIGHSKPKSLQKIFERIQGVNNITVTDSSALPRDIWIRYIQDQPVENNDWGDFQTHRRLLGLITVGKFDNQVELNELCRIHESLKVKYQNTLYDSRCILFGPSDDSYNRIVEEKEQNESEPVSLVSTNSDNTSMTTVTTATIKSETPEIIGDVISNESNNVGDNKQLELKERFTTPSNFKSHAIFYKENDECSNLESNIQEFLNGLFWILESKRLEKTREKIDKIALLTAPFEVKDFVGLDMESRNNKKRCMGRHTKHLGDLTLQAGLVAESLNLFCVASETLRAIGDSLWLGAAYEGLCSASAILLYPHLRGPPAESHESPVKKSDSPMNDPLQKFIKKGLSMDPETPLSEQISTSSASSSSSMTSSLSGGTESSSSSEHHTINNSITNNHNKSGVQYPPSILMPDEISSRYSDAIINYSKYRHAGIIETEAALKAARICVEQNRKLDVSMFLQNVLYINLNMNEQQRVRRFEVLTELYQQIGYNRKAAFCQRLAAWRHVAQSNPNPNWSQSYRLMLESFPGHKLSLEPTEVLLNNKGWPVLQIDLLQQLVGAARRLGQSALATRHMTFLLQTMWNHLTPVEQREMALQLLNLSSQCEGSPVALHIENCATIPPANLTDLPYCSGIQIKELHPNSRPKKLTSVKADFGPFIFTPLHFGSIDRRTGGSGRCKSKDSKITFNWVQHDLCEVAVKLNNPLPFELAVSDMRLLTDGIVFESLPQTVVLQPNHLTNIILQGTPIEVGELLIRGYSTHTLGVKSNCELKNMFGRQFPNEYIVNVIPALPKLDISTSVIQSPTMFTGGSSSDVIASASISLYNGETQEVVVTLTNTSNLSIEYLECEITSTIDPGILGRVFNYSIDEIRSKLPLKGGESLEFTVKIFGEADFVGPTHAVQEGPHSLPVNTSNTLSVHQSIPSRVNSPIGTPRRTELTSSFRSTHSGQSSINTLSLGALAGNITRQIEGQMRFKFTGEDGFKAGYCRHCAITFSVELIPSAQITNWDVLPAETGNQFYLVLDVINLTAQEMTLNYTENKQILIEAKESCRIPVPVERCDLDKMLTEYNSLNNHSSTEGTNSLISTTISDVDLHEKLCADHISNSVNLQWSLSAGEVTGVATLKGISLSNTMLDLVTVAPLLWDVNINEQSVAPQSEVTCTAGQSVALGIRICNVSSTALKQLSLSIQFYQDYQNGMHNYRLETRVIMSGPNCIEIPLLEKGDSTSYECSVLFFTPGRFKADIQCRSQSSTSVHSNNTTPNLTFLPNHSSNQSTHVWRFIPPVEVTVVE